ncbi:MAG: tetratricopeptide repeat protein, partial [Verrucomicrobiota bacterium]
LRSLEQLDLNISQGPDSDAVLVDEFDESIDPYCEWLQTGRWEKAVIAWKAGTQPKTVSAREGWDPKVGSGLEFRGPDSIRDLEFLRLDDGIEVYMDRTTGKEVYISRTSTSVDALFSAASQVVRDNFISPGQKPLTGDAARVVADAVEQLAKVNSEVPDWWNALWHYGKGQLALGNHESAYDAFRKAYALEQNVEAIPRELAGVCLELGKFDEAVAIAEKAAALSPDSAPVLGNLAVSYLLAGRVDEAQRTIGAAAKLDPEDPTNLVISRLTQEVADGRRPQPRSFADLSKPVTPKAKKPFWKFW